MIKLKELLTEASMSSDSKKFLKGMKKIPLKTFARMYMPGQKYVWYDSKSKKFYYLDSDGDYMELRNENTLKELYKFLQTQSITLESVNEANDTYFKAAYEAAEYAREMAEKKGYEIDEDDWQTQIGMGGKHNRLRPGIGKTHSFTVGLTKNGKPQRKALNISLYGMDSGSYELTYYIN